MSAFMHYNRNDSALTHYTPIDNQQGNNDDHFLLDMDSIVHRNKESSILSRRLYENPRKKCSLGDDGLEPLVGNSWSSKSITNWSQGDTINWLMSAASHIGQPYSSIQHNLAVSGMELLKMSRQQFVLHDPMYGCRLYDMLHSQILSNSPIHCPVAQYTSLTPRSVTSEEENARISSNSVSVIVRNQAGNIRSLKKCMILDAESDNSIDISTKRQPGRPKIMKQKKNHSTHGKLWEFIRDLLRNRETCPSLICWEDYSQAKFRFVRSDEVAKRWGSRKGNTKMTYEKLSRAMRYYYKSKIFLPVLGRRLVYQFGPNAKGWQTDNPNFRR